MHALKEAWRVLKPDGSMVDVRPLCVDVPLEVVYDNNSMPAGIVDLSPDIGRDVASDKALAAVIEKRLFYEEQLEFFGFGFTGVP